MRKENKKGGILFSTLWKVGKKEQGILERNFISMWKGKLARFRGVVGVSELQFLTP